MTAMESNRFRQLLVACGLVIGVPLTILLWAHVFERMGSPASAHMSRGEKALAAGRYLEAISAFGHARELGPADLDTQKALMRARAHLVAEQPMRITAETAEDLRYEANFLLDSDKGRAAVYHTVLGNIAARSGNADEARSRFDLALKADPNSLIAHVANAVFLLNQKDGVEKAKAEFESVLKVKPDHIVALVGLGQIALGDNKPEAAVEKLEAALKISDDLTARMLLGTAKLRLQKNDDAVVQYTRATQLDPRNAEAWKQLGQALLAASKAEDAERALRTAAQLNADAQTVVALGFALNRQKKPEQALPLFNAVLQQNNGDPTAMFGAGNALEDLGKKAEALLVYKKLISIQVPEKVPGGQLVTQLQQQAQQRVTALEGKVGAAPAAPAAPAPAPRRGR